jgi:hypothetical protein
MTPQEKAKEIYFKTLKIVSDTYYTKQCALIAVDEIINSYTNNLQELHIDFIDHNPIDYWQQVKQEIKKL